MKRWPNLKWMVGVVSLTALLVAVAVTAMFI
jgi:hypothetical protein